jgi:hypothetical protein
VEPSTRIFTEWTPSRIRSAEIQADLGNLRLASNLCDWLLGDDRIGSLLHGRAQALLGLDPTLEASGDKRRSNSAVRVLDAQEDWWTSYPETDLSTMIVWGALLGVAPFRHRWPIDPYTGRRLPCPKFWHPQHLRQDAETRQWFMRVSLGGFDFGTERPIFAGDGEWILHMPYGDHRPWTLGLWRGLARLALLKALAIGDWARHSEKGAVLATESDNEVASTLPQRQQLAQDIYDRGREATIVLPPGFRLKLIETVANTRQIYEAQINMANEAIAIAIRGGNLTTRVEGGSLAAANAQARNGDEPKMRFDAQALTSTLHDQSLCHWAQKNFNDPRLAPWPIYPVRAPEDIKSKADAMRKGAFALSSLIKMGFEVDGDEFAKEFGLAGFLRAPKGTKLKPAPVPQLPTNDPAVDEAADDDIDFLEESA